LSFCNPEYLVSYVRHSPLLLVTYLRGSGLYYALPALSPQRPCDVFRQIISAPPIFTFKEL
jgi:hypothetical protein